MNTYYSIKEWRKSGVKAVRGEPMARDTTMVCIGGVVFQRLGREIFETEAEARKGVEFEACKDVRKSKAVYENAVARLDRITMGEWNAGR